VSNNKGYEAESNESKHKISLQKQVARAENNVYTYKSWRSNTITHGPQWSEYHRL